MVSRLEKEVMSCLQSGILVGESTGRAMLVNTGRNISLLSVVLNSGSNRTVVSSTFSDNSRCGSFVI